MRNFLLADSGSTKTEWLVIENGTILYSVRTTGLNPYFVDTPEVLNIVKNGLSDRIDFSEVETIWFYGSGCSSQQKQSVIGDALLELFPGADITVEHDLLGAARALFGNKKGIAGILGTGSNSCSYDGKSVIDTIFSMGYVFGDEGSGAYLGKNYLIRHLKKQVPDLLVDAFYKKYPFSPEDIITNVYKKPFPSRFLASFTMFLKEQIDHPFISELVIGCFDDFFREQVKIYEDYDKLPIACVGSVAFHFGDQLREAARRNGLSISHILVSPMDGLLQFHTRDFAEAQ